jgi:hypothetical protein
MQHAAAIARIRVASRLARWVPRAASSAMAIPVFQSQENSSVEDRQFFQFETVCTALVQ